MIKIAIIEDEPINAQELINLIKGVKPDAHLVEVVDSISEAVRLFQEEKPQLAFVDIELADGNCFEIFKQVKTECPIIFTTAYDRYAVQAFEENSIAYLLKPITEVKVKQAFEALDKMDQSLTAYKALSPQYKSTLLVKKGANQIPINTSDIAWFQVKDTITHICTSGNSKYLDAKPLSEFEPQLDPDLFFRLNRQIIVHKEAIRSLDPYVKGQVKVNINHLEEPQIVSREKTRKLRKWLQS